jgi:hypothetical protein
MHQGAYTENTKVQLFVSFESCGLWKDTSLK